MALSIVTASMGNAYGNVLVAIIIAIVILVVSAFLLMLVWNLLCSVIDFLPCIGFGTAFAIALVIGLIF